MDAQADLALLQPYHKVIFYLEVLFDTSLDEIIYTNLGIKGHQTDYCLFCLCWGFRAQSTQWGHVERGQFT